MTIQKLTKAELLKAIAKIDSTGLSLFSL